MINGLTITSDPRSCTQIKAGELGAQALFENVAFRLSKRTSGLTEQWHTGTYDLHVSYSIVRLSTESSWCRSVFYSMVAHRFGMQACPWWCLCFNWRKRMVSVNLVGSCIGFLTARSFGAQLALRFLWVIAFP